MPDRISIFCPFCHQHTALSVGTSVHEIRGEDRRVPAVAENSVGNEAWIGECNYCYRFVLVSGDDIYPRPTPTPTDERIHPPCTKALDEAKRCMGADSPNASATMSRRAIQAAMVEKNAPKVKLRDQVDWLKDNGLITKDLADWAHEIRFIGNDGAHEVEEDVSDAEANDALDLAEQFLTVLYVAPAIAKERREKRLASKGGK